MFEIRWHARGGQGAKTGAMLLARAAMKSGYEIQAFPEYGPERSGAPITAYNRISQSPIRMHSGIDKPDAVIVLDAGLMDVVDVTAGLDEHAGLVLVNTGSDPDVVREKLQFDKGRLATVDADAIAQKETGHPMPNLPMLGAFIKIENIVSLDSLIESVKEKLTAKLGSEKTRANITGIKSAFQEVRTQ